MNEFFTILLKENESTNLKLLTEKLNDGFYVDYQIPVGRSTVVTLRRSSRSNNLRVSAPDVLSYGSSDSEATIPF